MQRADDFIESDKSRLSGTLKWTAIIVFSLVCLTMSYSFFAHSPGFSYRLLYDDNREIVKAIHVCLPGYNTSYSPADTVDLQKWTGTRAEGLIAINADGTENSEMTAGQTLIAAGIFPNHKLIQQSNGHYILYKSAKEWNYFSWNHYYKVWWNQEYNENDY